LLILLYADLSRHQGYFGRTSLHFSKQWTPTVLASEMSEHIRPVRAVTEYGVFSLHHMRELAFLKTVDTHCFGKRDERAHSSRASGDRGMVFFPYTI
jgi:hypothetical protein